MTPPTVTPFETPAAPPADAPAAPKFPPAATIPGNREAALALLKSWIESEDTDEPRETLEALITGLDANRGEHERKLFPPEKKGVTW